MNRPRRRARRNTFQQPAIDELPKETSMDMVTEMTDELDVKVLLAALTALKKGNFSARMPANWTGMAGKVADTLNEIIEMNQQMAEGITSVSRVVGREGR